MLNFAHNKKEKGMLRRLNKALMFSNAANAAANNISHVAAGVKRSLQVYNGEEEKKESPKDDWSGKFSVPNTKKRKLSGEEDRQTPTKNEIVFLNASNENIMPAILECVRNQCTLGEISDTLREVFGNHE